MVDILLPVVSMIKYGYRSSMYMVKKSGIIPIAYLTIGGPIQLYKPVMVGISMPVGEGS